jgi:hypothetical protein
MERRRPKKAKIELSEHEHASSQVMARSRSLLYSVAPN